ncbi:uncharacterized protein LOC144877038 [Branchiostoma floridae x Branchiostoma japonicum]
MHTAGWTGLLYLLCTARFAACELKQLDQCHYLASFPVDGNVTLPCNAQLMLHYVPQAEVRWYKDEKEVLTVPERVSLDHHGNLNLQELRTDDSGVYACQVGFPGGTEVIWSEVALRVREKFVSFEAWLEVKGSLGGARNVWMASAVSCVIITLLWVIVILVMCKRKMAYGQ